MKSSSYIDLQRFMLIPTKFPLTRFNKIFVYLADKTLFNY